MCADSRKCAAEGHLWHHYKEHTSSFDGHVCPEVWNCERGCNQPDVRTDPTKAATS